MWYEDTVRNGGYSQNGRKLGGFPYREGLQGNFSGLLYLAKHFFLGFLVLWPAKKPHPPPPHQRKSFGSAPLFVIMLTFAFTGLTYRRKVWENPKDLVCRQPVTPGRVESDSDISERLNWFWCTGWHYDRKGTSVFNLQEDFLFVKFDSRTMESWTQLQFPMSLALKVVLHM